MSRSGNLRHDARRDENEPELVKLARSLGAWLERFGPLDWWMFWRGRWLPVEIKTEKGSFTDAQVIFRSRCHEREAPYLVWRTEDDVLRDLGARRGA